MLSNALAGFFVGSATTYLLLTLAAAAVYIGLNIVQTAHRALVPERFDESDRPRATSAQELGQLAGALAGTVLGGVLVLAAPGALFTVIAVLAVLTALPTLRLATVRRQTAPPAGTQTPTISSLGAALRRRGTREILIAQALWVAAYRRLGGQASTHQRWARRPPHTHRMACPRDPHPPRGQARLAPPAVARGLGARL